jgi:hypothetical protein
MPIEAMQVQWIASISAAAAATFAGIAIYQQSASSKQAIYLNTWLMLINKMDEVNRAFDQAKLPGPADGPHAFSGLQITRESNLALANLMYHQINLLFVYYINKDILKQDELNAARNWSKKTANWALRFEPLDSVRMGLKNDHDLFPVGFINWLQEDGWFLFVKTSGGRAKLASKNYLTS